MRSILCFWGLLQGYLVWGQTHTGYFLSDGVGGSISSIMGLSAYPAQKLVEKGQIGIYGVKQFQTALTRIGFVSAAQWGSQYLMAGGDRFGNGSVNQDKYWASYSLSISKGSVLGLRAGVQKWSAKGYRSESTLNVGLGWSSELSDRLTWKVQVDGVESLLKKSSGSIYLLRSAIYFNASEQAGLSVECMLEDGLQPVLIPSFHYAFLERFYARVAAISNLSTIGFGVGMKDNVWGIEVSSLLHNKLGFNGIAIVYCKF